MTPLLARAMAKTMERAMAKTMERAMAKTMERGKGKDQRPPRLQQGWMNRFVHLAVLHDMGYYQEASNFIAQSFGQSPVASHAYSQHMWRLQTYGHDPQFDI